MLFSMVSLAIAQASASGFYTSAGHPKANGLTINLRYPTSWEPKEGERPHVVQRFTERGSGQGCNLLVVELGEVPARKEIPSLLLQVTSGMIEDGWKTIGGKITTIDSLPARMDVYARKASLAGIENNLMSVQFATIYDSSMVTLTCVRNVVPADSPAKLDLAIREFQLIAASIVIENQWRVKR